MGRRNRQEKGKILEELLIEEDLVLINNNEPAPCQILPNSYATIDLSIVSSDYYLDFSYKILSSLHGSDHYRILIDKLFAQEVGASSNRFQTEQ